MQKFIGYGKRSQATPQTEAIPGSKQVQNSAGGFSFAVDDMTRLQRLLILGFDGGTYYISERKLAKENLDAVERLLKAGRGLQVVQAVVTVSAERRAPSNDPALFVLARCCAADDVAVKRAAYAALPDVARTGTHLFHFMEMVKQFRGRGHMHQTALKNWYNQKQGDNLAYQLLKYQGRDGWTERDVLRLTRPKPVDADHNALYQWVTKGWQGTPDTIPSEKALAAIWAFERAKNTSDANEVADLIIKYRLPREAVPTQMLNNIMVWEALLESMPLEALVRNLATMTKNGVLVPMGAVTQKVVDRLRSVEEIKRVKLHPIAYLKALMTYQSGKGGRGSSTWVPIPQITDALDAAFYLSFGFVVPTLKRHLLALDVSGSMETGTVAGVEGLTPRIAAAAMALVTANVEPNYVMMAFSHTFVPFPVSPRQRIDDVVRKMSDLEFGGTDCSLPMLWAMEHKIEVDVFCVYTDSETWAGKIHPVQALRQYRQRTGIPAKLVVIGMTSGGFSIADPDDAGMLDCVGFDTATPQIIAEFTRGAF